MSLPKNLLYQICSLHSVRQAHWGLWYILTKKSKLRKEDDFFQFYDRKHLSYKSNFCFYKYFDKDKLLLIEIKNNYIFQEKLIYIEKNNSKLYILW